MKPKKNSRQWNERNKKITDILTVNISFYLFRIKFKPLYKFINNSNNHNRFTGAGSLYYKIHYYNMRIDLLEFRNSLQNCSIFFKDENDLSSSRKNGIQANFSSCKIRNKIFGAKYIWCTLSVMLCAVAECILPNKHDYYCKLL